MEQYEQNQEQVQHQQPQQPYPQQPYVDTNSKATKALVFGILSFVVPFVNIVFAILGIVFGNQALKLIEQYGGEGKSMAQWGKWLGIANLILVGIALIFYFFVFAMLMSSGY